MKLIYKRIALAAVSVILYGCASGQVSTLPRIDSIDKAATLNVIRENRFTGSGVSSRVILDEQPIAMLENGSHIIFKVQPGNHSLSFSTWQLGFGWMVMDRIDIDCLSTKEYFVKFRLGMMGGKMQSITREEAAPLISETKYLPLEQ